MPTKDTTENAPPTVGVQIETLYFPSEDKTRIEKGISTILDPTHPSYHCTTTTREGYRWLIAKGKSFQILTPLYHALRKQRILDTVRKILLAQLSQDKIDSEKPQAISICFNKQHATAGKLHVSPLSGESPLGPLQVILASSNLSYLVDWLTPQTQAGKPLKKLPPHV